MTRVTSKRIETPSVQGEGSFIVVKPVSYSMAKKARSYIANKQAVAKDQEKVVEEETKFTEDMIFSSLVNWNWTDDAGEPLPLPRKSEDLDLLTMEEVDLIVKSITGMQVQEKNSVSGS